MNNVHFFQNFMEEYLQITYVQMLWILNGSNNEKNGLSNIKEKDKMEV